MIAVTVRAFKFILILILIWAFCRFMGTSTSYTFLFLFTVLCNVIESLTFVTLCYRGGGPVTFTSNANPPKVDSTE